MDELQRVGLKVFCAEAGDEPIALVELIPVFHRWIQQAAVSDLLIDVADYSHVASGPGVLLVGLEGIYAMDETDGRRGMTYYFRRPPAGTLEARLRLAAARLLSACRLLETCDELGGGVRFDTGEFEIYSNDRLHAPNRTGTLEALAPAIDGLLARLYPGTAPELVRRHAEGRERFTLGVRVDSAADVATLLERVSA